VVEPGQEHDDEVTRATFKRVGGAESDALSTTGIGRHEVRDLWLTPAVRPAVATVLGLAFLASCGEVRVPNVVGQEPEGAAATLEAADLSAAYRGQPVAGERCTVREQSRQGAVEPGTRVILELQCRGDVPNVEGLGASKARGRIESAGFSVIFRRKPTPAMPCTVAQQNPTLSAVRGSRVVLSLSCALTARVANRAAERAMRGDKRALRRDIRPKKRRYELDPCDVVTEEEAECGLTFMRSRRTECSGLIRVKLRRNRPKATLREVDCDKRL
jgi:hypothetical protein